MAYSAELMGAAAPGPFIYVWPSRDLIARSWSWPASCHDAFQDAASRIGLAVALYALDGGRFARRLVSLQLSIGAIKFRVKRRGSSLYITVVAFTGPDHSPDSPDGTRQPSPVEGLILGLHGSGENAYLVVFHGQMPFIPAGVYRGEHSRQIPTFGRAQSNMAGNNKMIIGYRIGDLLRAGSASDIEMPKGCDLAAGNAKNGRRARTPKPGVTTLPRPRCDWTKATTLASPEMTNGCLARLRRVRPNSQPILVVFDPGRGRKSLVSWFLDEKHSLSHVLSKRLH
jgi:hypothetical protein